MIMSFWLRRKDELGRRHYYLVSIPCLFIVLQVIAVLIVVFLLWLLR